jgi:hypothetical protein
LNAGFESGEAAQGDYALDVLNIGGTVVQDMEFGIMYTTTVTESILGVSFPAFESIVLNGGSAYNNLPTLLVNQGYIQSRAFSVWLNDDEDTSGVVLFGGVDTDKYYGDLVTLPLVEGPGDPQVRQFYVTLQGVQVTGSSGNIITPNGGSTPQAALLDTGTTFILLPDTLAESIWAELGAVVSNGFPNIECSLASSNITVDFIFTGITINVPLSQIIDPNPGQTDCILGLLSNSEETVLGDTFLSSAYVVFDLDNKQAHLAPAVFGATSQNIVQIGSGPNAVPSVSGQPITTISTPSTSTSTSPTTSTTSTTSSISTTSHTSTTPPTSATLITSTTFTTLTTCYTSTTSTTSYTS